MLAAAYLVIAMSMFSGTHDEALLAILLAVGGLGLGTQFASMIGHLTNAVSSERAPDISGVSTAFMQLAAAVAVAGFGTAYLGLASKPGAAQATDAFAVISLALAVTSLGAAVTAHLATRRRQIRSGPSSSVVHVRLSRTPQ